MKAKQIQEVEVELDDWTVDDIVTSGDIPVKVLLEGLTQSFLKSADLPGDAYLHDGKEWSKDVKYHSWDRVKLRDTTKEELAMMEAIANVRSAMLVLKLVE